MSPSSLFVFGDPGLDFIILVFVQIAVVCGLGWLLARGRSPVVRSKVWTGTLAACLCGPVLIGGFELSGTSLVALDSPLPHAGAPEMAAEPTGDATAPSGRQPSGRGLARGATPRVVDPTVSAAAVSKLSEADHAVAAAITSSGATAPGTGWRASSIALLVLVGAWLLGVLIGGVRLGRSIRLVARLKSSARPLDRRRHAVLLKNVSRAFGGVPLPHITISDDVPQPLTLGGRGIPTVVLPGELLHTLSPSALRDVLVHECAHVLQGDLRLGWLQSLAHVLYWPHPCVYLLNRELSIAREELCDNHVLGQGSATDYARTLVSLCERPHLDAGVLTCGLLPSRWSVEQRVVGLLDLTRSRRVRMGRGSAATLLAALVGVSGLVGGTRFDHESDTEKTVDTVVAATAEIVKGRVVTPDGAPAKGVPIYLYHSTRKDRSKPVARTEADGRFEFEVVHPASRDPRYAFVVATKPGFGFVWRPLLEFRAGKTELRLVVDRPVEGRILNLEGVPVPGVSLKVANVYACAENSLDAWLAEIRKDGVGLYATSYALLPDEMRFHANLDFLSAVTDGDGRFALHGIGAERLATMRLSGETVVSQRLHVITRAHASFQVNVAPQGPAWGIAQVHGHRFEHHVAPTRIVAGVVRDGESGELLVGAKIRTGRVTGSSMGSWVSAETDAKGAFRLVGLPKGEGTTIKIQPGPDDACFPKEVPVPDPAGLDPIAMDIALDPGILLRGKIVDEQTKDGVAGFVDYLRGGLRQPTRVWTAADGSFSVVVNDGPAVFTAAANSGSGNYKSLAERMDITKWKEELDGADAMMLSRCQAVARVDVKVGGAPTVELTLARGTQRILRFFDPEGAPLTGVRVGYANAGGRPAPTPADHWVLSAAAPGACYGMILQHSERRLAAFLKFETDMPETTDITLVPWARIEGRLVDDEGKPRAGVKLELTGRAGTGYFSNPQASPTAPHTDSEGRFVVEGLVPEIRYNLQVQEQNPFQAMSFPAEGICKDVTLEAGKTRKLGDVQARAKR